MDSLYDKPGWTAARAQVMKLYLGGNSIINMRRTRDPRKADCLTKISLLENGPDEASLIQYAVDVRQEHIECHFT